MVKCAAENCENSSKDRVTTCVFPKDQPRRDIWIKNCGLTANRSFWREIFFLGEFIFLRNWDIKLKKEDGQALGNNSTKILSNRGFILVNF